MLRPYQEKAVAEIRSHYADGRKKVLLKLATGGGKTVIFSHVMTSAAAKGTKCIMAVRGRHLVEQAHERLLREHVNHGVQMAGHYMKRPQAPIQICSIDTLNAREKYPFLGEEKVLIVIDEAHMACSESYRKFVEQYPQAFILAVTATPYVRESLSHIAECVVNPISMTELIEQGFLVPPRYFAPSTPDLKGVRKQNGDYVTSQLEERMSVLTGDIVQHWINHGENRPTIVFACNISHSLAIVERFKQAGINAEHIEGNNTSLERKAAIQRLGTGESHILSNVGVLCTGVDIPFVSCLVMARPTQSYNLFIQQAGRGTRIFPGKEDFIILDHAGNLLRHGFITDEPDVDLGGKIVEEKKEKSPARCESCYSVFPPSADKCPVCGAVKLKKETNKEKLEEEGILEEIRELPKALEISIYVRKLREMQKKRGYKKAWIHFQLKDKYGQEVADRIQPLRQVKPWFVDSTFEPNYGNT